ncbi:hypothetical protein IG631_13021 [Alternaria alternata]|nr:hypothetical protein IG631_13021 [Alternaria alternata]
MAVPTPPIPPVSPDSGPTDPTLPKLPAGWIAQWDNSYVEAYYMMLWPPRPCTRCPATRN